MTITVELPDDITSHANPGREALEALAIEGYRSGALTPYQTRMMLGFAIRDQLDGFLKTRNVIEGAYDVEALRLDLENLDRLESAGLLRR